MKTSLSHLQFENEQLKTEVAKLKEEHRSIEDRLVQEQVHSGDLAARLDDARNLLSDRGVSPDTRVGSRSGSAFSDTDEELAGPRTLPAGRSTRKRRKPPAASIPGDLDAQLPAASDGEGDGTDGGTISFKSPGVSPSRNRFAGDFETPPRPKDEENSLIWQPVARGSDTPPAPTRR